MIIDQATPRVNTIEIVASRTNGRSYAITIESQDSQIEIPVDERIYRRAIADFLSPEDIEELNRWLDERYEESVKMQEADFGEWPPLPPDDVLEDMADAQTQSLTGIPMF